MKLIRWILGSLLLLASGGAASLLLWQPASVTAQQDCEAERCAAQAAIDAQCPCEGPENHGDFVNCVAQLTEQLVSEACQGEVVTCAGNSICGRDRDGAVACLKPDFGTCDRRSGTCVADPSIQCTGYRDCVLGTECTIKSSAAQCERQGGTVGTSNNCCAACPTGTTTTTTLAATTTTRATTTSTTTTMAPPTSTTVTSTTTTTQPSIQCCVQSSPMGAFDSCVVVSAAQCAAQKGIDVGAGTCSPNPCPPNTTTTAPPTTTTGAPTSTTTTTTAPPTTTTGAPTTSTSVTTTTTTTQPSIQCCVQSSPMGAFDSCVVVSVAQCAAQNGIDVGAGTCSPNPCPPNTTTTAPQTTTTAPATTTTATTAPPTTTTAPPTTTTAPVTTTTTTTAPATTTTAPPTTTTAAPTTTTSSTTSSTTTTAAPTTTTSSTTSSTTTSSTTSSTTSTTMAFTKLSFTTTVGTSNCGGAGLSPPASAPLSGQLYDDIAETTPTSGGALGLGCLNIGGGNSINLPPDKIPDAAASIFTVSGGTLSGNAGTGPADCTLGLSGSSSHCLTARCSNMFTTHCNTAADCPAGGTCATGSACTSDSQCDVTTPGSCGPDANCFFGPPLPIPNGGLSTCVLNVIKTDASGTFNEADGSWSVSLPLVSRVYLTGNSTSPCPKCVSGSCVGGPNNGGACSPVGSVGTSLSCPPSPTVFLGGLDVDLTPLTSGKADKTSASGSFCPSQANAGAFGKTSAQAIVENGSNATGIGSGMPVNSHLASVFCIPPTGNIAVDTSADLPGPGAIGLNGTAQLLP